MFKRVFIVFVILITSSIIFSGCLSNTVPYMVSSGDDLSVRSTSNSNRDIPEEYSLLSHVDPFIGTDGHGHTYPGATAPFGMVQLSPDNGVNGWDWTSGYHYSSSAFVGFSHKHLSGTGVADLGDIGFLPTSKKLKSVPFAKGKEFLKKYYDSYSHENERAFPGYYSVLTDSGIFAEVTTGKRSGYHHYVYPEGAAKNLVIELDSVYVDWDVTSDAYIKQVDSRTIIGYRRSNGWIHNQSVYFTAVFSEDIETFAIAKKGIAYNRKSATGSDLKGLLSFSNSTKELSIRVGISSVSNENALNNIIEDGVDKSFEGVLALTMKEWDSELSGIEIKADKETNTIFYTALYHSYLAPTLFSDSDQSFRAAGADIAKAEDFDRYTLFSLWDTFRALHPLFSITQTEKTSDFINSMLEYYERTGRLPMWELEGGDNYCMIGNHGVSVIAEAVLKNIDGIDPELSYRAIKDTLTKDNQEIALYEQYGYLPNDMANEAVSKTLEFAYDDWCAAQIAKKLNYTDDYDFFLKRSESYINVFNPSTGFMQARDSSGKWLEDFNPFSAEHRVNGYTEGTGWQFLWFVPHNPESLISLLGGKEIFTERLSRFFTLDKDFEGENISGDITGVIGQYAHGNEPGHHTPYLFNYVDEYEKTVDIVREIMGTQYKTTADGICGNEDAGQMSAWYLFSALGFYPVNPNSLEYQLGIPAVQEASINVGNGKQFNVINEVDNNAYPKEILLNGNKLDRLYITHDEIMSGGELLFR